MGPVERFPNRRKGVSSLGLNPSEPSSGGRQRLGHISKQGNEMLRWLLVEAGQSAAQFDRELRRKYQRLKFRRGARVAKVAIARHRAPSGGASVLDAAPDEGRPVAGSHAREPGADLGGPESIDFVMGPLASLQPAGRLKNQSWLGENLTE